MDLKKVTGIFAILTIAFSPSLVLAAEEDLSAESLAKANAKLESSYDAEKGKLEEGVNLAVEAGSEEAKKLEEAAQKAASEIVVNPNWVGIEPKIEVIKWGPEFRIKVKTNAGMKKEKMLAIKSVKLETLKGEFLGLKTYTDEEKTRDAEFMVNAEILKIDTVKITVTSPQDGDYVTISPLKVTEVPEAAAVKKEDMKAEVKDKAAEAAKAVEAVSEKPAAEAVSAPAPEKPKKKKGWW